MDFVTNLIGGLGADKTLPIMMGIFLLGYLMARLTGFGTVAETLVERDERTAGREVKTEEGRQKYSEISLDLETRLKGANAEVSQVFSGIRSEAIAKQNDIIKIAREKAQTEVEKARLEIARTMDTEVKKIKEQSIEMAALIVQQLTVGHGTVRAQSRPQREV